GAGRLSTVILRSPGRPVATSSSTALSNEASRTLMQSPDNRSGRDLLLDSDSDTGSLPGDHDAGDEDDLDEGHQPPPPPPVEVRTSAQFLNLKPKLDFSQHASFNKGIKPEEILFSLTR